MSPSLRPTYFIAVLLALLSLPPFIGLASAGQDRTLLPGLSVISDSDIRNSVIAFVNTTTAPGLEGATLGVDNDLRSSEQWRSSLGFNAEVTLKDHVVNGYWGLGVVGGSLSDQITLTADDGSQAQIDLRRDILSLRASLGLSIPINQHFKLRPFLTFAISDLGNEFVVRGVASIPPKPYISTAQVGSTAATINALYWYWFDDYKLELSGYYNLIYTDTFSEDNPILDNYAWNQTAQFKSSISGPTPWKTLSRPWRWQLYANHSNFISIDERALGYTGFFEIGGGLEWEISMKPLDWFGWSHVGINAGTIQGKDLNGFNVGLTAR